MDYRYYEDPSGFNEEKPEGETQKTYTVKYIGVVEGSMGILSRKMRMPKMTEASIFEKRDPGNQVDASSIDYKAFDKNHEMHISL